MRPLAVSRHHKPASWSRVRNHRRPGTNLEYWLSPFRERRMPALLRTPALLLALTIGCGSGGSPDPAPSPEPSETPRVRIENRASLDMDIYLVRSDGQRIRLGFVPGGETATFALPPTITAGTTSVQFEARPVRRSGQSVLSEPFGIRMSDEITWSVPPQ
jgi:hypothetical protein